MDDNHDNTNPKNSQDEHPDDGEHSGWKLRMVKEHHQSEKQSNDGHIG